jgi:hypothetical protein
MFVSIYVIDANSFNVLKGLARADGVGEIASAGSK